MKRIVLYATLALLFICILTVALSTQPEAIAFSARFCAVLSGQDCASLLWYQKIGTVVMLLFVTGLVVYNARPKR